MSSDSEENDSETESVVDFEEEIEELAVAVGAAAIDTDVYDRPQMGEPLADEKWFENYNRQRDEENKSEEMLRRRLNGTFPVESW